MVDLTDAELDRLVERLQRRSNKPDGTKRRPSPRELEAATAITALRARIAELEADRAEWVEVEQLRMGKV